MRPLYLYEDYSREEVHDIFAPLIPFTLQIGSWSLHELVSIARGPGGFVIFVAFGQQQDEHVFDEGVYKRRRSIMAITDMSISE